MPKAPQTSPAAASGRWPVVLLPGLNLDSLGNYLAALGLLRLARKWPAVRACWRGEEFALVNGPADVNELKSFLVEIGANASWSPYGKPWYQSQKADTKTQTAERTACWRAFDATEEEVVCFQSHLAVGERLNFNPLFGTGGNSGKRDFTKGWEKAVTALEKPPRAWSRAKLEGDLDAFLTGGPCECLADYNAACWFSAANKAFNSGTAKPFREGQVTPWAMALACEAFPLLRGSASRQLGSRRRATGAFPFVVTAAAPEAAGETGRSAGEAWMPVWYQPLSSYERCQAIFGRFIWKECLSIT
jgi:CRISPR-associated protein Csx17